MGAIMTIIGLIASALSWMHDNAMRTLGRNQQKLDDLGATSAAQTAMLKAGADAPIAKSELIKDLQQGKI